MEEQLYLFPDMDDYTDDLTGERFLWPKSYLERICEKWKISSFKERNYN